MRVLKFYDARLLRRPLVKYRWHGENLTFEATPETEKERARVLLKAYKDLDIEDIFTNLRQREPSFSYSDAYAKLADHLKKSGIPALIPISEVFEARGEPSRSPLFSPSDKNRDVDRWGGDIDRSRRADGRIHLLLETISFDKGGLEQVVFNLAKGLGPEPLWKVVIIVIEKGGYFAKRCKEIGIPVEVLEHDRTREYREVLERYQIDLVLSHYSTFGARLAFERESLRIRYPQYL